MSVETEIRDKVLVVIPAHDEMLTVAKVVERVRAQGFDVVVVDDASDDDTSFVAEQAGAAVLRLPFNVGAWVAMQTGIRYAVARGYGYAVTLDADGQHDPAAIPDLVVAILSGGNPNVVIGSHTARGSPGRKLTWWLLRTLGRLDVMDLTSGYRIYDRTAMEVAASREATLLEYQDVGVLLMLLKNNIKMCEVDVLMAPRVAGKSRIYRSWLRVGYYLAYSLVLCASKMNRKQGLTDLSANCPPRNPI
jgi:glycosyltransferase involved in cell wall biosynthesis